ERLAGHRCRVLEIAAPHRGDPLTPDEVLVAGFIRHQRPSRTWTCENSHLLGSSFLCVIHLTLPPEATMASMTSQAPAAPEDSHDPYLWLEEVTGEEALDWVRARNEPTLAEFCDADFEQMRTEALEVLDTDARIPYVG